MSEPASELVAQIQAIRAIAATHDLLNSGSFPLAKFKQVESCIAFLENLHIQCLDQASSHSDADLIPELKQVKASKESQDV